MKTDGPIFTPEHIEDIATNKTNVIHIQDRIKTIEKEVRTAKHYLIGLLITTIAHFLKVLAETWL